MQDKGKGKAKDTSTNDDKGKGKAKDTSTNDDEGKGKDEYAQRQWYEETLRVMELTKNHPNNSYKDEDPSKNYAPESSKKNQKNSDKDGDPSENYEPESSKGKKSSKK